MCIRDRAIDDLLNGVAIRETPAWLLALLVIAMAAAGGAALFLLRHLPPSLAAVLAMAAAWVVACFAAYGHAHLALPLAAPELALVLSFGSATAARYITTGRQLRQTRGMLDRYMSPQLVEYVIANIGDLRLNGDKRELTILVSDPVSYTHLDVYKRQAEESPAAHPRIRGADGGPESGHLVGDAVEQSTVGNR